MVTTIFVCKMEIVKNTNAVIITITSKSLRNICWYALSDRPRIRTNVPWNPSSNPVRNKQINPIRVLRYIDKLYFKGIIEQLIK